MDSTSVSPYRNVLITGANRNIGLEFVRQFLSLPNPPVHLIATTRSPSDHLQELQATNPNLHILTYNADHFETYDEFVQQVEQIVGDEGLDLLINNAGVYIPGGHLHVVEPHHVMDKLKVNSVAPLILTKSLLPLLKKSSSAGRRTVVANLSSQLGSIEQNSLTGGMYAYRASKAALNMLMRTLKIDLEPYHITVVNIHPGHVSSNVHRKIAITPQTSVSGMMQIIGTATFTQSGLFVNYLGKELPW